MPELTVVVVEWSEKSKQTPHLHVIWRGKNINSKNWSALRAAAYNNDDIPQRWHKGVSATFDALSYTQTAIVVVACEVISIDIITESATRQVSVRFILASTITCKLDHSFQFYLISIAMVTILLYRSVNSFYIHLSDNHAWPSFHSSRVACESFVSQYARSVSWCFYSILKACSFLCVLLYRYPSPLPAYHLPSLKPTKLPAVMVQNVQERRPLLTHMSLFLIDVK